MEQGRPGPSQLPSLDYCVGCLASAPLSTTHCQKEAWGPREGPRSLPSQLIPLLAFPGALG